jgi:tetratricopeptide (TPR) repeat protein
LLRQDRSLQAELARPMPERYRLAAALARRAAPLATAAAGDARKAATLLDGIEGPVDDPTDTEALDDALERCVDALAADPHCVRAWVFAGRLMISYGFLEDFTYHPRPLRDALKLLERARALAPGDGDAFEGLLQCELLLRRDEQAHELLAELQASGRDPFLLGVGRGIWFWLHDNFKLAEEWFEKAVKAAPEDEPERLGWALCWLGMALWRQGNLPLADARMGEGVLLGRPHRLKLHLWSKLKHARGRYDEAFELNRRSLTFGLFDAAQRWRQELLVWFRRLGFVPRAPFSLPEETRRNIDGPFRYVGSDFVYSGDAECARDDDDDEFVPVFRVNLFLEGEHLPVVSDIADPGASFEGRARLTTRVLEARTLEKRPLQPGERFKPGQYIMRDERAGTVFHVLLMKRHNLHDPYLDLPEDSRSVFDLDRTAVRRFENAPWDVRLMLVEHGFDPLLAALSACKLCDSFLRFAGGIGVDLETGLAVSGGDWRNESPATLDIRKHVIVRARQTSPGRYWLRTAGLCKFLRPELEVCELPHELVEGARSLLLEAAAEAAQGEILRDGDVVGSARCPLLLRPSRRGTEDAAPRVVYELVDVHAGREPVAAGATKGIQALLHIHR